jgi:hypothetical protein
MTQAIRPARSRPLALLALFTLALHTPANAATYHVNTAAANDSGDGSPGAPKKYLSSGAALLSGNGGDTLIIAPGTYASSNDALSKLPAGRADAYNVIKAASDGTVTIKQTLQLTFGAHYLQFEGLKWDHQSAKVIVGSYVKFVRCAFKGGPASGNTVTVVIGSNDATPGASDVLLEDSWVYGPGGRYKVLVYNADRVVLRRVVVRHDGGWTYDNNNPQAGIAIYDSTNIQAQNVMSIDGMTGLPAYESNIYLVTNGTTSQNAGNVAVRGAIIIGGGGNGIAWDGSQAISSSLLEDVVVWGASAGGIASNGAANHGTINRATVKSGGTGLADWRGNGVFSINSVVLYGNSADACTSVNVTASVSFGNGNNNCGTTLNPLTSGLKYLPRTEAGSVLATAGAAGGPAGAQVTKRIGTSGTLYGETGYDTVSTQDLWPWPNEARIKTDFAEYNSRGFSAGTKTLTDYIWSFLGSASPIVPAKVPAAPLGFSVN